MRFKLSPYSFILLCIMMVSCKKSNTNNGPYASGYNFKSTFWGGEAHLSAGGTNFIYDIRFHDDNTALWRGNAVCGFCPSQYSCTWKTITSPTSSNPNREVLLLKFDDASAFGNGGLELQFRIINNDSLAVDDPLAPEPELRCIKKFREGVTLDYNCP